MTQGEEARYLVVPIRAHLLVLLLICVADGPSLQPLVQRLKRRSGIAGQCHAGKLVAVELGDVDVDETNFGILKRRARGGREVAVPGTDTEHQVGFGSDLVRGRRAGGADRAQGARMVERQRAFARLGLDDRDAGAPDELAQDFGRLGVDDAAPRDDERLPGAPDQTRRAIQDRCVGQRPREVPDALLEKRVGVVVGLGLHILGQRQRGRAGVRLARQDTHRGKRRGDELLRPLDAVEVARHRNQGVVHADITPRGAFQLLQHRIWPA